ncbi:MAG: Ppx/GppA family phosphatase [Bacteroidales bacterium]|jgi:exopolyphosphatase/guanosine-5'-triphosphate,3'-diphosphate pyrophosphatase|nr:Ppx/GppA family phosphatase [Bacteroidales bacterium]
MLYAAIDIGSNAVRLLFANVFDKQGITRIEKASLIRIPLQLGKDVFKINKINSSRAKNLINTMKAFKLLIDVYKPVDFIVCATAAMREAENNADIMRKIKAETGMNIHLIDGSLEAKIIRSVNTSSFLNSDNLNLLIDVGGGSTELSLEKGNSLIDSQSFKLGTIRLLNNEFKKEIWGEINKWLDQYKDDFGKINCLGTGGNINKYAKLYGQYDIKTLSFEQLKKGYNELRQYNSKERTEIYGFRPDRADVIIPAGKIYLEIMKHIQASSIFVPRIGFVDGLILGLHEKTILKTKMKINKSKI